MLQIMANAAIPMISYEDVGAAAADWLSQAFGFEQSDHYDHEGVVTHVMLTLGDAVGLRRQPRRRRPEPADSPAVGQRQYRAEDPEGHR
jgi:uncharacterized glyoxalase superfamily protein PhnB